nr:unnamed protein product [Digitaria exilis]
MAGTHSAVTHCPSTSTSSLFVHPPHVTALRPHLSALSTPFLRSGCRSGQWQCGSGRGTARAASLSAVAGLRRSPRCLVRAAAPSPPPPPRLLQLQGKHSPPYLLRGSMRVQFRAAQGHDRESGNIFFAKEMPASTDQAAEASKDTGVRTIGSLGNKIRIRLPPRKRLAEGTQTQTMSTVGPDDTKNHLAEVSEHTDNNTPSTTLVDTKVKAEEVCSKAAGVGQCEEANSNILIKTMSKDTLSEEANLIVSSLNLTTATEVQVKEEISCPVRKELCEEGNKNIMSKVPLEDSSNTARKESYVGAIDNTTSKNMSIIRVHDELEKKNSINIIPSNRLIYETNRNSRSKGVTQEAKIKNPRKNLTTSAVNGDEENDKSLGNNLFEEARKNIMSTEAINYASNRRPAIQLMTRNLAKDRAPLWYTYMLLVPARTLLE